ncbi:hypothetical protein [Bradyrhizobium sp. DOA9]|nr:hypothetical protein [Bradyrhizobium sp. DOA9]
MIDIGGLTAFAAIAVLGIWITILSRQRRVQRGYEEMRKDYGSDWG